MHAPRILSLVTTVVLSAAYLDFGVRPQNPEVGDVLADAAGAALGAAALLAWRRRR